MKTEYSLRTGFYKGLISIIAIAGGAVAILGFADVEIWGLIVTYIKPVVGGLTVGGAITMALNWLKFYWKRA